MMRNFASAPTMAPSPEWVSMDKERRIAMIQMACRAFSAIVLFLKAEDNGHVTVKLCVPTGAAERGTLLLDIEEYLKANIDPGITVWLAPMGDRNSLRGLRGIEMK